MVPTTAVPVAASFPWFREITSKGRKAKGSAYSGHELNSRVPFKMNTLRINIESSGRWGAVLHDPVINTFERKTL